jgi:carbon-monoxide dehydrogenase medium subunit
MGGLGSGPLRASATEHTLAGKPLTSEIIAAAAAKAAEGSDPQDDLYAGVEYKRQLAPVLAQRAIELAVERTENKKS